MDKCVRMKKTGYALTSERKRETKLCCHLLGDGQTPEIDVCAALEKFTGDTGALRSGQHKIL